MWGRTRSEPQLTSVAPDWRRHLRVRFTHLSEENVLAAWTHEIDIAAICRILRPESRAFDLCRPRGLTGQGRQVAP